MDDVTRAEALDDARNAINSAGAADLDRRPWQHAAQPASDADLVRFAAWVASDADAPPEVLAAGLSLLWSARAELDQVEAALLFAARAAGMTWPRVAGALGLGSAQAAQQRLNRVLTRVSGPQA